MDTSPAVPEPKIGRVTVSVTAEHIERAIPMDSSHCMIADAIKAAVPKAKSVSVDLASIRWTDPRAGKRYLYLTPPSVQQALIRFDNGQKPTPFRFTLRQPAQVGNSGAEATKRGGRVTHGVAQVTTDDRDLPTKIGGTLPPIGPLTNEEKRGRHRDRLPDQANLMLQGRRRAFGIRRMGRVADEIESATVQAADA
jgi:hypothetical protein